MVLETNIYPNKDGKFAEEIYCQDKPNTGVCFSGGGSRAQVLAMGQLRGLEELDLIKNIRYISSVSGGSWASTAYAYRKDNDTSKLLGDYVNPKDITLDVINSLPSLMAQTSLKKIVITDKISISPFVYNYILNLQKVKDKTIKPTQMWQKTVGDAFLKPLGLVDDFANDLFTLNEQSQKNFEVQNTTFKNEKHTIFHQNQTSPYLIVNGTVTQPTNDDVAKLQSFDFMGVEFTPLYTEIPYTANNGITPDYGMGTSIPIGNGAIDSLVYGSNPTAIAKENSINVSQSSIPLGLSAIAGISSNFLGSATSNVNTIISTIKEIYNICKDFKVTEDIVDGIEYLVELGEELVGKESDKNWFFKIIVEIGEWLASEAEQMIKSLDSNPSLSCWSPLSSPNEIPKIKEFDFGDGGCMDNYGIMPLLKRGVEKIVVFINTDTSLTMTPMTKGESLGENVLDYTLLSLFGATKLTKFKDEIGTDISHNQVFNKEELINVVNILQENKKNNKAVQATTQHQVQKNDWWGIDGEYNVEICWVYNEVVPTWEDQLPIKTQQLLNLGSSRSTTNTNSFPLIETISCTSEGFKKDEANALAHLGAWNVADDENKDSFINLLKA